MVNFLKLAIQKAVNSACRVEHGSTYWCTRLPVLSFERVFSKWQEIMHVVVGESHENPTIRSVEEATGGDDC
ncbi:uncharacterized protein [Physcomitrium patens]|uniref:uncharacterized protein isoform X1 n=1 Tax=Physcomitrium patens TaxID=3218 RepID=UPI003CCDB50D